MILDSKFERRLDQYCENIGRKMEATIAGIPATVIVLLCLKLLLEQRQRKGRARGGGCYLLIKAVFGKYLNIIS